MPFYLTNRLKRIFNRFFPESESNGCGHPLELVFAILKNRKTPTHIVQIGASDGSLNDPLADFLSSADCRGVLVEPLPDAFSKLSSKYASRPSIICRQVAIDSVEGVRSLYTITDDCTYMAGQLTSFSRDHLLKNGVKPGHIKMIEVPTTPLARIIADAGLERIDLLQVDTEGFDDVIVQMGLALESSPIFINFEHLHLSYKAELTLYRSLVDAGYSLVKSSWDTLAWKRNEISIL